MLNEEFKKALAQMQANCSRSEKCCYDIKLALKKKQIKNSDIEQIIELLVDDKFINDERYALYFVRDKFRLAKWGKQKISYMLKNKQIAQEYIGLAFAEIDDRIYRETLKELIVKKRNQLSEPDKYKAKDKILRFAVSRGFETALVFNLFDELGI